MADATGGVGRAMAAHLPRRPRDLPTDVVRPGTASADWDEIVTGRDLPRAYDPPEGFVASANDRPADRTPVPVGFFFSPDERVRRLRQALAPGARIDPADLAMLHADVGMPSAPALRDLLSGLLDPPDLGQGAAPHDALDALRAWDGRHDRDSAGALAFELLLYHFIHHLHGDDGLAIYRASLQPLALLREDVARLPDDRLRTAAASALDAAAPAFARYRTWGAMHRLRLAHPLGHLPLIGRRWRFADLPVGGSNETLMKTAHGLSSGRHGVGFGANARLIADMADPDATHFVILGGQDGRFGSDAFLDQLDAWRAGNYRTLPLTARAVATAFPAVAHFGPCPGTERPAPPLTRSFTLRRRQ
jgi:penicillin amidase